MVQLKWTLKTKLICIQNIKTTTDVFGQQETIEQKLFYKDGEFYVSQGELKYKIDLDLDEAMEASNQLDVNNFINEDFILGGSVRNLENGNKEYTFDIDFNKAIETSKQFLEGVNLTEEELQSLDNLNVKSKKFLMVVNSENKPISYVINFDIEITQDSFSIKVNADMNVDIKDIDKTVVIIPDEDLDSYQDFNEYITEEVSQ